MQADLQVNGAAPAWLQFQFMSLEPLTKTTPAAVRHRDVRASVTHQDHGAINNGVGRSPSGWLARGGYFRGR